MDRIRELEGKLVRFEGTLCVVLVLLILVLAGYNVLYRNVLVPLQSYWAHSGPPITATADPAAEAKAEPSPETPDAKAAPKKKGSVGGFGGAFGGGDDSGGQDEDDAFGEDAKANASDEPDEEAGGFGGAFGEGADEDEDEEEEDESGFGGAFGKPAKDDAKDGEEDEGDEFFVEDEFENLPEITVKDDGEADQGPVGGPPPKDSFAAKGIAFIDAIKLDWIDVFARHLVIIVSFLGAAIATRRQKHINIDALSKILKARGRRITGILTNTLALSVCLVLANSGQKLVAIGRQYPREIVPFADQWMFQLMFPIGFGLVALHFGVRLLEAATGFDPGEPEEIATRRPEPADDDDDEPPPKRAKQSEPSEDDEEPEDAPESDEDGDEAPEEDSADERTDVVVDPEETAPGDVDEADEAAADASAESIDENEEAEEDEEGRR